MGMWATNLLKYIAKVILLKNWTPRLGVPYQKRNSRSPQFSRFKVSSHSQMKTVTYKDFSSLLSILFLLKSGIPLFSVRHYQFN